MHLALGVQHASADQRSRTALPAIGAAVSRLERFQTQFSLAAIADAVGSSHLQGGSWQVSKLRRKEEEGGVEVESEGGARGWM
uniref:Uncharacterized protein n=1 Tax=Vespula pensylvanica TaxID=30213 RepID=A0A834PD02_VESPE|nr:hypothetical protein H0235_003956 [Vespula pensylvanica]